MLLPLQVLQMATPLLECVRTWPGRWTHGGPETAPRRGGWSAPPPPHRRRRCPHPPAPPAAQHRRQIHTSQIHMQKLQLAHVILRTCQYNELPMFPATSCSLLPPEKNARLSKSPIPGTKKAPSTPPQQLLHRGGVNTRRAHLHSGIAVEAGALAVAAALRRRSRRRSCHIGCATCGR